jgi:hypothetical protein
MRRSTLAHSEKEDRRVSGSEQAKVGRRASKDASRIAEASGEPRSSERPDG